MTITTSSRLRTRLSALCLQSAMLVAGAACSLPVQAVHVMDLRAEGLMVGADSIRKELALTPNQQTLWQQSAAKAQALLRTRQLRRERLQAELKTALAAGAAELRELNRRIEAETATAASEERELRELWLGVNDALSDQQRTQITSLLLSQLERIDADGARPGAGGPRDGGKGPGGGGPGARGQRPGGMGGMSPGGVGAGGNIGVGGASVGFGG